MIPLQILHNMQPLNPGSLSFVYIYLPAALLVYYIVPKTLRPAVLLTASLGFIVLSQPRYLPLLVFSLLADFGLTQGIVILRKPLWRRLFLLLCIAKNIIFIGYFSVITMINPADMPLGLFIYCLSGISAALEAYREKDPQPRSIIRFALYLSFFPRLYAGPLVPCGEFCGQLGRLEFDAGGISLGFGRFAQGVFKYAVFGRELFFLYNSIRLIPAGSITVLSSWSLVVTFALALYYTLSGLADIARGIAGMFGLTLPQNFYYPYQSRSVSDFFERFNMTVGAFLKNTVQIPAISGGSVIADILKLLLVGVFWGMWFGMRSNYIVWGTFIAVLIILEKYLYPGLLKRVPTLFCRGYALVAALIGFTLFAGDTLAQSSGYFPAMFVVSARLFDGRILYLLASNWLLIVLSCLLATNALSLFVDFMRKRWPRAAAIMFGAIDLVILVLFTAFSLGGGNI